MLRKLSHPQPSSPPRRSHCPRWAKLRRKCNCYSKTHSTYLLGNETCLQRAFEARHVLWNQAVYLKMVQVYLALLHNSKNLWKLLLIINCLYQNICSLRITYQQQFRPFRTPKVEINLLQPLPSRKLQLNLSKERAIKRILAELTDFVSDEGLI